MQQVETINWPEISGRLNEHGYAILNNILDKEECDVLKEQYNDPSLYRKTIAMERYRFGLGEYKYFTYPLPGIIEELRQSFYPHLAPIANKWMEVLGAKTIFPGALPQLLEQCHQHGQNRPTPLILKYGKGGYNTLHQDLYGDIFFPMQMVLFLDELGKDYDGGEFVLIEQRPRAQSKAMVLKPKKGDVLVFTTSFRPVRGSRGYYRVNMKHGVGEVIAGNRHTLGIIFHDAA